MQKLESKVAIVTGGASGLGKAVAQRLMADGAKVVITDIQADLGNSTASEHGMTFLEQDVSDEARWSEIVQEVERRHGRLDILVNNAGVLGPKDAINPENTRLLDLRNIFRINVEGTFLGCKAAIPAMRRTGAGSIINMSSVAGLVATPYATAYGASKAAVRHLTKSVAQHCMHEKLKIRCNSVHPGDVRTPLVERSMQQAAQMRGISMEQAIEERRAGIPMGEFVMPEDIAAAVAFLASEDSRYITGAKFVVDGGIFYCDTYHMVAKSIAATRPSAVGESRDRAANS